MLSNFRLYQCSNIVSLCRDPLVAQVALNCVCSNTLAGESMPMYLAIAYIHKMLCNPGTNTFHIFPEESFQRAFD